MKESVVNFFELVRQDEKLAEQLRSVANNVEEFSRVSCQLGRERGFEFEPTDVQTALADLTSQKAELTDEQLAAVGGGTALLYFGFSMGCQLYRPPQTAVTCGCGLP